MEEYYDEIDQELQDEKQMLEIDIMECIMEINNEIEIYKNNIDILWTTKILPIVEHGRLDILHNIGPNDKYIFERFMLEQPIYKKMEEELNGFTTML
jgi:hypothetical protein